jgi:hypothetical protein
MIIDDPSKNCIMASIPQLSQLMIIGDSSKNCMMASIPIISPPPHVSQIQNKLIICTHFKIDQAVSRQYNNHM